MRKVIEVKHLYKLYRLGNEVVRALDGVDFTIYEGEFCAIVGTSGSGKSTFLRSLNLLEVPTGGQILFEGTDITDPKVDINRHRQKIGMVFQSYDLFPHMTVMDNILLGPTKVQKRNKKEAEAEAEKLLERVGLLERKDAYPRQLSGGQKQRVAIVRALIMKPEIMLFDEVTAALDPEMVREVLDVMLELAKSGSTMMIVTHEMQFARAVADKIVFLDGGEIVETGAPEEFFNRPKTERARRFLHTFTFDQVK